MSKYERDYFEEMNIDYEELKDYKDVETYYDEIQDFTNLLKELQCDRVECQKYIVRANKEIERLNNVIDKLEEYLNKIIDTSAECERITCKFVLQYLQELKGSDKNEDNRFVK